MGIAVVGLALGAPAVAQAGLLGTVLAPVQSVIATTATDCSTSGYETVCQSPISRCTVWAPPGEREQRCRLLAQAAGVSCGTTAVARGCSVSVQNTGVGCADAPPRHDCFVFADAKEVVAVPISGGP